ncbi:MAG: alpha-amylase family glycosyl hydrolase [Candidatus Dormiibacterota bacterium]
MTRAWWHGAIFYEIYVRSFADSNDDGIGDLPGITSHLDYVKDLGADAIWLTPFYPSPQRDHGYDVADYVDVNPEYGTLADFDHLVERARELRLKVLVDIVPNHTSDQHPWFKAAISSPDNPFRQRYVFADSKPDGSPPNNWESIFGGPAWKKDEGSGQWYLHLFAPEQPDLNWWNPEVPAAFEGFVKFWLDRGADGFRIDVAAALFKRKDLADRLMVRNPITGALEPDPGFAIVDQPQVHEVYRRWRQIANGYQPDRVLVGEILETSRQSRFILPEQLNMAFALVRKPWKARQWQRSIDIDQHALRGPGTAPSWTLGNHDVARQVTRLGGGHTGRERARAALLLMLGLPGQAFLYQGDELGLEEVVLPDDQRQDPVFFHSAGKQVGRDGCRVPLPWRRGRPNAGFSDAPPWLPMPAGWDDHAIDAQLGSAGSMLRHYRSALALRLHLSPSLPGLMEWRRAPEGVLLYTRGPLAVACNFLDRPTHLEVGGRLLLASNRMVRHRSGRLDLPPNSAAWLDTGG